MAPIRETNEMAPGEIKEWRVSKYEVKVQVESRRVGGVTTKSLILFYVS
jgi:hypothetical protein